ncbi:MAG TPA: FIST N-terminal domain-containing protein, partial [Solirubrobacteraceae bacterium]|nr:FIST N-terminal domain-containing protein [Solirubrobacteraceae bacterium]
MSVRVGVAISTVEASFDAGAEAGRAAAQALDGAPADLVLVFASGDHLGAPEAALEAVHATVEPETLVGCAAGGVLGSGRELESGTGLAVWAASFGGDGQATPFHATIEEAGLDATVEGLPPLEGASGTILLTDPYSFPTDAVLGLIAEQAPGVPVLGAIASAHSATGPLFIDGETHEQGAVGVSLEGVEMLPCVSQGAAPLGRELTITAAEGNIIHELAGRPALQTVERIIAELSPRERGLVAGGLLIGIVIDSGKPDYEQGDFLVRGVLGADPDSGSIAVGAAVRSGQVVRLHARDALSADEDLRRALRLQVEAMSGGTPAGALLFSC